MVSQEVISQRKRNNYPRVLEFKIKRSSTFQAKDDERVKEYLCNFISLQLRPVVWQNFDKSRSDISLTALRF